MIDKTIVRTQKLIYIQPKIKDKLKKLALKSGYNESIYIEQLIKKQRLIKE